MTSPYTRGDGAGAAEDQPFEAVVRVMQQAIEERRDGGRVSEEIAPIIHRTVRRRQRGRRPTDSAFGGCGESLSWIGEARVKRTEPESLMFSTWSGKPISPNNVLRRWIVPACETLGLERVTWLTLRRTYSSWAHEKGVPGKVIAQLMGHAKVDTSSTCTRRSSMAHFAEPPTRSDPNCSRLFTNRRRRPGLPSRSSKLVRSSQPSDFARFTGLVHDLRIGS